MQRGCISLGDILCNGCHRMINYAERYLAVDEGNDVTTGESKKTYYCIECALEKGFAYYKDEKGERILTFFSQPEV